MVRTAPVRAVPHQGPAGPERDHRRGAMPMGADAARQAPACALVIFGASGDLTERKLLPAIRQLAAHNRLCPEFALVGVARTAMSDEEWADKCLSDPSGGGNGTPEWAPKASFRYVSGGYDDPETHPPPGGGVGGMERPPGTTGPPAVSSATPPPPVRVLAPP